MHVYKAEQLIDVPIDLNLTELLNSTAHALPLSPNHVIARDDIEDRTLTISELRQTAGRLANGLVQAFSIDNSKAQKRWAVILPNSVAYIEACHAVLWCGGVFCPINHQLKPSELGHAFLVTKPDFVIVYAQAVGRIQEGIAFAKNLSPGWKNPDIITAINNGQPHSRYRPFYSFLSSDSLLVPHYSDTRNRLASIHLSSGTTGTSKGVGLSHFNYIANVLQMWKHDPDHWQPSEKIVSFTPFVHIANTTIPLFLGPWAGMCHVIMAQFNMNDCMQLVQEHKATAMQLTPGMAIAIINEGLSAKYDLSSIRHMVVGGLPLTKDKYEKFLEKGEGKWKTVQLYGMTEASPYVVWQKVDERLQLGQLGKLLPGIEARLCDDDGRDVDCGKSGELWIRGPNVTAGYVDNPAATAAAFREGGWYNTGDVCKFSPAGHMTLVGRTKELIKYKGFQVAPTELETYLNGHSAIGECAVGATVDRELMTELPTAYVVLKSHIKAESQKLQALEDICQYLNGQVSGYKKLRGGVWEVTQIPKTGKGSFMRKQLGAYKTGLYFKRPIVDSSRSRL